MFGILVNPQNLSLDNPIENPFDLQQSKVGQKPDPPPYPLARL